MVRNATDMRSHEYQTPMATSKSEDELKPISNFGSFVFPYQREGVPVWGKAMSRKHQRSSGDQISR